VSPHAASTVAIRMILCKTLETRKSFSRFPTPAISIPM